MKTLLLGCWISKSWNNNQQESVLNERRSRRIVGVTRQNETYLRQRILFDPWLDELLGCDRQSGRLLRNVILLYSNLQEHTKCLFTGASAFVKVSMLTVPYGCVASKVLKDT